MNFYLYAMTLESGVSFMLTGSTYALLVAMITFSLVSLPFEDDKHDIIDVNLDDTVVIGILCVTPCSQFHFWHLIRKPDRA